VQDGVTGYSIPDQDPDALASALKKLLGDSVAKEEMGRRAAENAREYSWPVITSQIVKVYEEIVKGDPLSSVRGGVM
jgi:D-inositol-3-phosphate glycosyltransferase